MNRFYTAGNRYTGQTGLAKCRITNRLYTTGNRYTAQTSAALKCPITNRLYTAGNCYAGQARAITKSTISNFCHTAGNRHIGQTGAAAKCIRSNGGYTTGNLHVVQTGTFSKYKISDFCHTAGNRHIGQTGAAVKCTIVNGCHIVGNRYTGQIGTTLKYTLFNGCHLILLPTVCHRIWNCEIAREIFLTTAYFDLSLGINSSSLCNSIFKIAFIECVSLRRIGRQRCIRSLHRYRVRLRGISPPPTVARAGAGIMLTAILTASAILINRFFICKSPLIKICSADLPRQESRTHPLLFCPRWTNHQHHCNKFWSIWQCFKANCRISGKMAFQPAFRPEEGGDFSLTFAPVQHIIRSRM